MIAPPNPYRCPPGPYERVSMFAHVLKRKGHKRSKIIVLDPKPTFSKQALFMEGWEKHYPGMIEWHDPKVHGGIKGVDPADHEVKTDLATHKAALVNVIPAQMAGRIARDAGLANETGFCPIDPESMKSTMDPNVFVVGDACIPGDMPKSAFSANSQAKVAAMTIRGELAGSAHVPGALFQHLLEPDRARRRREGRRQLRAGRGQDQAGFDLRQPEGRGRRSPQAELPGIGRLVCRHHRRRVRVIRRFARNARNSISPDADSPARANQQTFVGKNCEAFAGRGQGGPCLTDAAREAAPDAAVRGLPLRRSPNMRRRLSRPE